MLIESRSTDSPGTGCRDLGGGFCITHHYEPFSTEAQLLNADLARFLHFVVASHPSRVHASSSMPLEPDPQLALNVAQGAADSCPYGGRNKIRFCCGRTQI
jgi:hypothetical protein